MQSKSWQEHSERKLIIPKELEKKVAELRYQGKRIATLNGSFDLLHAGHMYMLYEAAKTADILIVAVNSDLSVKAYKSAKRPIVPLKYRLEMLSAIEFVDYLTWFDETDPCFILEKIRPDVHVNGIEYGPKCIEADTVERHGGRVHFVDRIPSLSTSELIERVKQIL